MIKDLTIIKDTYNSTEISEDLLNNIYLGNIVKLYGSNTNNLEQLNIINNKEKLSCADIYEIITSKYPKYVTQLIIESKVIKELKKTDVLNSILKIINNCEKDFQALGIVFFVTQIGSVDTNNLIKTCDILSKINSIPTMYYSLKIALLSNSLTTSKKMVELTKIISNSLTDNHAKYAYSIGKKYLKESKNPIKPTYKASKIKKLDLNNNPNNYI